MHLTSTLALISALSFSSLLPLATAQLITADNHSFGGVNFPLLQYFTPKHRDETIRAIVKSKARVIRLFIRPDSHHTDPEPQLGEFDKSLLDQLDDTLAAVHRISEGQVKVIIAPHDAHALRSTNNVPCDAYCEKIGGAFLDFYSNDGIRAIYKTRLDVFFKHYPSKNFGGRSWSELSEVIMGVDIQNQPFSGIWPIPSGESWLCDIATHLKFKAGLDSSNISVISGGVSGLQSLGGIQNFPDSIFECPAIDVIGIHGRFAQEEGATAGTPWGEMFIMGNTLTARAHGKQGKRKLLLVEEWEYVHTDSGLEHKKEAIFDQGNALNLRGIPWIYSHLSSKNESTTPMINPLRPEHASMTALTDILTRASTARSNFNWSSYLPAPSTPSTSLTEIPLNPYIPADSTCVFGCEGHLCSSADSCAPTLLCKNNICRSNPESQPGQIGSACNSKKPCQPHLRCSGGACQACSVRPTLPPPGTMKVAGANDANGSCAPDAITAFFGHALRPPTCLSTKGKRNPCENAQHCDGDEYCSWGVCTPCSSADLCLGAQCKSNNACKTGFCNSHGRCDYGGQKRLVFGPGVRGRWKNGRVDGVPEGHERGPAKVRSEAMRIVIPTEGVMETGQAQARVVS
ncbi:glycoside hydrolase family 5 protein [Macroventuria anomochaeta]|uniref:Glycoside hydrolase family 5 protein n=1 Tax=Macroventuria anomochaeta TaxID=301207 RepID=A0ACB6RS30_9PLEO|nr:glycoside hydrolase family 5 protein [Macroventuria anomochaeta]KAF2624205.1 glycoside hydrolase family 5 protein [Macroventuria anomochaeta]